MGKVHTYCTLNFVLPHELIWNLQKNAAIKPSSRRDFLILIFIASELKLKFLNWR